MSNIFNLDVDIKQKNYINEPVVTQHDDVVFILRITDNGAGVNLSEYDSFSLTSVRPDGKAILVPGSASGDSRVEFDLGTLELEISGTVNASIQIYAGGRVSSIPFTYRVLKDLSDDYVPTENDLTLIELVMGQGPAILNAAEQATIDANTASSNANTATTNVTASGDYATAQGDYAKAQGNHAKTEGDYANVQGNFANAEGTRAKNEADRLENTDVASLQTEVTDNKSEFDDYVSEYEDKHIAESGSNSNGNYIKFEDGTLICTQVLEEGTVIGSGLNNLNIIYPSTFVKNPYVDFSFIGNVLAPESFDIIDAQVLVGARMQEWVLRASTPITIGQSLSLLAIGRWK